MITAFIPAKSRSTRVPGKNFRPMGPSGKSLLQRTIEWCREDPHIGHIVVATDAQMADTPGIEIMRLTDTDLAETRSTVHLLSAFAATRSPDELICKLHPTSPFRLHCEFAAALDAYIPSEFEMCSAMFETTHQRFGAEDPKAFRTQDRAPTRFAQQGAWTIGRAAFLAEYRKPIISPSDDRVLWWPVHPVTVIDIDWPADWELAELISVGWDLQQNR